MQGSTTSQPPKKGGDREDGMDVIYIVAPVVALTLYAALMAVAFG